MEGSSLKSSLELTRRSSAVETVTEVGEGEGYPGVLISLCSEGKSAEVISRPRNNKDEACLQKNELSSFLVADSAA